MNYDGTVTLGSILSVISIIFTGVGVLATLLSLHNKNKETLARSLAELVEIRTKVELMWETFEIRLKGQDEKS